jgi:hypothetical protein
MLVGGDGPPLVRIMQAVGGGGSGGGGAGERQRISRRLGCPDLEAAGVGMAGSGGGGRRWNRDGRRRERPTTMRAATWSVAAGLRPPGSGGGGGRRHNRPGRGGFPFF